MNVGKHARGLALALVLGTAILGISTGQAEAAKNTHPKDDFVRCYGFNYGTGEHEFSLPGEKRCSPVTQKCIVCGKDGEWHTVAALTTGDSIQTADGGALAP